MKPCRPQNKRPRFSWDSLISLIAVIILAIAGIARSEESLAASDSIPTDSGVVIDSVSDSLIDPTDQLASFEDRYQKFKKERPARLPSFVFADSLVSYFISDRVNVRDEIEQSFFFDAGDYFRFNPSYFITDPQVTPMRKTVQPFGLAGDRLNLITQNELRRPFEHVVEPDGMSDLNDLPTALDYDVYLLPGAAGQILGGNRSVATLLTRRKKPAGSLAETALKVDKGSFVYNYVRGKYTRHFESGRELDMSIGYRKADGITTGRDDDAYHYYGDVFFPVGLNHGLRSSGHLYDRQGALATRPEVGGTTLRRGRIDRSLRLAWEAHNDDHTVRQLIGFSHLRQGSNLESFTSGGYWRKINLTGNRVFTSREWITSRTLVKAEANSGYRQYDDQISHTRRYDGEARLTLARPYGRWRSSLMVGSGWDEDYHALPMAALLLLKETNGSMLMFSAGYSERAPALYELSLYRREAKLLGGVFDSYSDEGRSDLKSEKQLVGSLLWELGEVERRIGLEVTGGRIFDGIDWQSRLDSGATRFQPLNGDVDFVTTTLNSKIRLKEYLSFRGGLSYHYVNYEQFENRAYLPEFQAFSGMELHYYWERKLMHLYAYGEISYLGDFHGYRNRSLGRFAVANTKLSFRIKDFRFNLIFQNSLSTVYQLRDGFTYPGRYFSYGFTWNFLD